MRWVEVPQEVRPRSRPYQWSPIEKEFDMDWGHLNEELAQQRCSSIVVGVLVELHSQKGFGKRLNRQEGFGKRLDSQEGLGQCLDKDCRHWLG